MKNKEVFETLFEEKEVFLKNNTTDLYIVFDEYNLIINTTSLKKYFGEKITEFNTFEENELHELDKYINRVMLGSYTLY